MFELYQPALLFLFVLLAACRCPSCNLHTWRKQVAQYNLSYVLHGMGPVACVEGGGYQQGIIKETSDRDWRWEEQVPDASSSPPREIMCVCLCVCVNHVPISIQNECECFICVYFNGFFFFFLCPLPLGANLATNTHTLTTTVPQRGVCMFHVARLF